MPDLPNPPLLTANGTYEVDVTTGREYLLTLKGNWDGAELNLTSWNHGLGTWSAVDGADWINDDEVRLVAPSSRLRFGLVLGGPGAAISITLIPILK